jgi:hypothetical protein
LFPSVLSLFSVKVFKMVRMQRIVNARLYMADDEKEKSEEVVL